MANFDAARNIPAKIRGYLSAPASSLTPVPETENLPTQDAIRKLQLQIFELSDALAATARELQADRADRADRYAREQRKREVLGGL